MDAIGTRYLGALQTKVVKVHGGSAELKKLIGKLTLPQLRFYPNRVQGDQKKDASFEIFLSGTTIDENIQLVTEVLHNDFSHEVTEINENYFNELAQKYTKEENKTLIFYLYDDVKGVDINFKALSVDPWMEDDFAFVSIHNPSDKLRDGENLPTVAGALRETYDTPS